MKEVYILGAGPAGLCAAIKLLENGVKVHIIEREGVVGGQCRTNTFVTKNGEYRFDLGGHRFITHNKELLKLVEEVLKEDLLVAQRSSVIRFKGKIYAYPLNVKNLMQVAPLKLLLGSFSDLLKIALGFIKPDNTSFESWISSRFGKTLYQNFFAPFTKKLWGIEPSALSSDWAGQRISLVDLKDVVKRLLCFGKNTPRTYARAYRYPKFGFGDLAGALAKRVIALGGEIHVNERVEAIETLGDLILSFTTNKRRYVPDEVISTLPMNEMAKMCGMKTCKLRFRSLRFLNIALKDIENISTYTWQYLSDANMLATRLQEPKRRSSFMAPKGCTSVMLEIPCNKGDAIWQMEQSALLERVLEDLESLGLELRSHIVEVFSTFEEHAYTLMDLDYKQHRDESIAYLNQFKNLVMCGRQGTFRYIFVDTAMETGFMAAGHLLGEKVTKEAIYEHRNEAVVIETQSIVGGQNA